MKFKSLESLRGLAAIIVALFHSSFESEAKYPIIAQGAIFVDFFFVLSGFVIAFAYLEKIKEGIGITKFALLRFGRIYPLHLFTLIIWLFYILAKGYVHYQLNLGETDPFQKNSINTFIANLLLINSLGLFDNLSWNYPAWSISVEFYTYFIFFIFIFTLKTSYKPIYALLASLVAYLILINAHGNTLIKTYDLGIFRCIGGFFLGVFIYSFSKSKILNFNIITATLAELLIFSLMIALVLNSSHSKTFQLLSIITFAGIVYLFSVQEKGIVSRLLKLKPMVYLGTISYSIYMVHAIVYAIFNNIFKYILKMPTKLVERDGQETIKIFDTIYADLINLTALIIIIGLSYLTYEYVEKPWRDKFRELSK